MTNDMNTTNPQTTTEPDIGYIPCCSQPFVLVGCEESQAVTIELRKRNINAFSCDLKTCSGGYPEWHLQMDVFEAIKLRKWDGGIFFPDCTYLTISAEWAYTDGPYHQKVKPETLVGLSRREAREKAIEFAKKLYNSGIEKLAMENPVGVLSSRFRKPDQIIQPYQFGDDASKKTCLWLKGLSTLKPTNYIEGRLVCCGIELDESLGKYGCPNCEGDNIAVRRWANQTNSGQNRLLPGEQRAELRSKTYPGIARAMAEQWAGLF